MSDFLKVVAVLSVALMTMTVLFGLAVVSVLLTGGMPKRLVDVVLGISWVLIEVIAPGDFVDESKAERFDDVDQFLQSLGCKRVTKHARFNSEGGFSDN